MVENQLFRCRLLQPKFESFDQQSSGGIKLCLHTRPFSAAGSQESPIWRHRDDVGFNHFSYLRDNFSQSTALEDQVDQRSMYVITPLQDSEILFENECKSLVEQFIKSYIFGDRQNRKTQFIRFMNHLGRNLVEISSLLDRQADGARGGDL